MFPIGVRKEERQSAPAQLYALDSFANPSFAQQPNQHITQVPPSPKASLEYPLTRKRGREDSSSSYDHKDDFKANGEVWLPMSHETLARHQPWTIQPQHRSSLIPDPNGSPPFDLLKQFEHEPRQLPSIKHLTATSPRARHWEYTPYPSPATSHGRSPLGVTQTITPPSAPHPQSRPSSPSLAILTKEAPPSKQHATVGFIETTFSNAAHKKTHKRRPANVDKSSLFCHTCGTKNTPEWRRGPSGPATLCNACGLAYAKRIRQEEEKAAASASPPHVDHHAIHDHESYQAPPPPPPSPSPPSPPHYGYQMDPYEQAAAFLHAPPHASFAYTPPTYEQLAAAYGFNLRSMQQLSHSQLPLPQNPAYPQLQQGTHPQISHIQAPHSQAPIQPSLSPSSVNRASFRASPTLQKMNGGHTFHQYFPPPATHINYQGTHIPIPFTTTTTTTSVMPYGLPFPQSSSDISSPSNCGETNLNPLIPPISSSLAAMSAGGDCFSSSSSASSSVSSA